MENNLFIINNGISNTNNDLNDDNFIKYNEHNFIECGIKIKKPKKKINFGVGNTVNINTNNINKYVEIDNEKYKNAVDRCNKNGINICDKKHDKNIIKEKSDESIVELENIISKNTKKPTLKSVCVDFLTFDNILKQFDETITQNDIINKNEFTPNNKLIIICFVFCCFIILFICVNYFSTCYVTNNSDNLLNEFILLVNNKMTILNTIKNN
jgi:hypothetical protein